MLFVIIAWCVAVGVALLTLASFAAIYWASRYDHLPEEAAPDHLLARFIFWWSDVLWVFRAWWGWTCPHCQHNYGSTENLALHLWKSPSCGYYLREQLEQ